MPNVIEITDFAAPELDVYARLTQAQLRSRLEPEKGIFIAESPKVIARALDAGYQPISFLMERKQITGPASEVLARCGNAPVYTADRAMLAQLTGFELTRGVLCAMHRPLLPMVEEVCRNARRVAVLEGIVDSTNIGAIFRSAAALNMDAVLVTPSCCDPLCRRAVRVSMGTVFQVPWTQIGSTAADWPEQGMQQLHALGFKTAAMALTDLSVSIDDAALAAEPKLAIVLGTEGDGLAHTTIAACDYTVRIPMSHGVNSLNVAMASAVGRHVMVRNVSCLFYNNKIYFKTDKNFRKTQQLFENPNVALCWSGVQVEGVAENKGLVVDEPGRTFETLYKKYLWGSYNKYSHEDTEILIEVTPKFVEIWDTSLDNYAYQLFIDFEKQEVVFKPYDKQ